MALFAGIIFGFSLLSLGVLFGFKVREMRTGRYAAPALRAAADFEARRVKELLVAAQLDLKNVPVIVTYWGHVVVRAGALGFARSARTASRRAHQLADFVSRKYHFQREETRSEFLRKMSMGRQDFVRTGERVQ